MIPTLSPGEHYWAVRRFGRLRVGDVVLAKDPRSGKAIVKRVHELANGSVTLRGDNEAASVDSRNFGVLPTRAIHWRLRGET